MHFFLWENYCAEPFLNVITLIQLVHISKRDFFFGLNQKNNIFRSFIFISCNQCNAIISSTWIPEQNISFFFLGFHRSSFALHIPHLFLQLERMKQDFWDSKVKLWNRSNCQLKHSTNLQQNTQELCIAFGWSLLLINNVNYFYPFFTATLSVFTITNFSFVSVPPFKKLFPIAISLEWFPHNERKSMSPCSQPGFHFTFNFENIFSFVYSMHGERKNANKTTWTTSHTHENEQGYCYSDEKTENFWRRFQHGRYGFGHGWFSYRY